MKNNISEKDIDEATASLGIQISSINQTQASNNYAQTSNQYSQSSKFQNTSGSNASNPALESQIRNYFQNQIRSGYSVDAIKNFLLQNNYDYNIVTKIANELSNVNINVKHEVHFSKGTIIAIMLILFVGGGVYSAMHFGLFSKSESLLDVSITTFSYVYVSGENINYQIYITNMGSAKRFDAIIKTVLIDDIGNIITRKEETIAVETTSSITRNIQVPQNTPSGKYYLKVIADYDGKQATSTNEVQIVKSVLDKPPINTRPNTGGTQGGQTSTGSQTGGSSNTQTGSSANSGSSQVYTKTFSDILSNVKSVSLSNPNAAVEICEDITQETQKDICFETIAATSKTTSYCSYMQDVTRRDNCYMSFLMAGETVDICDKISDSKTKEFCDQLRLVQLMDKAYAEGDTEKLIELSKLFNPSIYTDKPEAINQYQYTEEYYDSQEPSVAIEDIFNDGSGVFETSEQTNNNVENNEEIITETNETNQTTP